ncbi:MAG TPA: hypothetical protein DCS93_23940 [Microscillaceae bacterium]|nr:hypothetical protein [Microscillaceae bacterium]
MIQLGHYLGKVIKHDIDERGFGFIRIFEKAPAREIFYHFSQLQDSIAPSDIVVFQVIASQKHRGKLEAQAIQKLPSSPDLLVALLTQARENLPYLPTKVWQAQILPHLGLTAKMAVFPHQHIAQLDQYQLFKLSIATCPQTQEVFAQFCQALSFSPEYELKAWLDGYKPIPTLEILSIVTSEGNLTDHVPIIRKLGWRQSLDLFQAAITCQPYDTLRLILTTVEDFDKNKHALEDVELELTDEVRLRLWIEGLLQQPASDIMTQCLLYEVPFAPTPQMIQLVGTAMDSLMQEVSEAWQQQEVIEEYTPLQRMLELVEKHTELSTQAFLNDLLPKLTERIHFKLWYYHYLESIPFDIMATYFGDLSAKAQKSTLKRLFYLLKQQDAHISLVKILSLNQGGIKNPMADLLSISDQKLDFAVYVILQMLQEMAEDRLVNDQTIFEIIAQHIHSPKDMLLLADFLDKCEGRLGVGRANASSEEEPTFEIKVNRGGKPSGVVFCEGRKVIDKTTRQPKLNDINGQPYWWCRNASCYQTCVQAHTDWPDYTLLDFMTIAQLPFKQEDYELLMGYINKVERFIQHLFCQGCHQMLRPLKDAHKASNYGLYRVSRFSCQTEDCTELGKEVYLTRCINGACTNIIDSRESVKCKPEGDYPEDIGWYVCKACHGCCTTEKLNARIGVYHMTGQTYQGHADGHKDLGQICCTQCGHVMEFAGQKSSAYQNVLQWFLTKGQKSKHVLSSGQRKTDHKYWFRLKAPQGEEDLRLFKQKLANLVQMGFQVPEINQTKNAYMVSEPFATPSITNRQTLVCPKCSFTVDFNKEKYDVMRRYHQL